MKIAIGYDPNAASVIPDIEKLCHAFGYETVNLGSDDPIYANTAIRVGETVAAGEVDRGILVCGTGIGMSIAANKVKGVYAALLTDPYSAQRAVLSNNSNVACIGAFTVGRKVMEELLSIWLEQRYDPSTPSAEKVQRYIVYDQKRA